jgi:hypothetical protein
VRALATSPNGGGVLVLPSERGWRLPCVELEADVDHDLRQVTRAFEASLGEPVTALRYARRAVDRTEKVLDLVYVLERLSSERTRAQSRWASAEELAGLAFELEDERRLAVEHLRELESGLLPPQRVPWTREGWLAEATAWIDDSLAACGRVRSGRVEQMRVWCLSALLRVPTDGGIVFFKATAPSPLFVDEGSVMEGLARLFPENVPSPLARDGERRWMLLDDLGPELGWQAPVETREEVLALFARIQIESSTRLQDLFAIGCVDRRLEWLASETSELLADDEALEGLDEAEVARLRSFEPRLDEARSDLEGSLPYALAHGDLHLSNVARVDGRYVIFDWTDAGVAHPFFDLIDVFREEDRQVRDRLRDRYLSAWLELAPMDRLLEIWDAAQPLAFLNHAVSYRHIVANVEPEASGELRWALPYFLRKVLAELED